MNFSKNFREYIRIEKIDYKNENIEKKYFKNMKNNQFLKVKNSLLELENGIERQIIERQRRKNLTEIEELFFKPIIVSKDDMDKFEEQEMKKIRLVKTIGLIG